jgi:ketosteroid isomerase-like protein
MSEERVKLVRESVEAWNRGDLDWLLAHATLDWEWHTAELFPGTDTVYRGREGAVRFWSTFREPWERIRIEIERIEELSGDRVLVLHTFYGRGKGSGVQVTQEYGNIYTFREGLVASQVGYGDWGSALSAAGLED